ncbi:unnamed protein product [Trichobilharzia szidati]|nr:unnamed protein product [Trichobilharzia szidati]
MTEEGLAEVTLSLCVGNNPENLRVENSERICDYLDSDYWASILLASTESHDAELLGYMGPEYTCRKPNRFNFERSESRRRKREIVLVQEEFEPHDQHTGEHFSGVNILPETVRVYEKIKDKEEDEFTPQKMPSPQPSSSRPQTPKSPKSTSPRASIQPGEPPSPKPQKIPSKITNQSKDQAPIIGRAEPPGKTKAIISSPKSKENFEELKRQWNNRIAKMQERMDNQYKDAAAPTTPSQTYTEGHRGSVITSILPTVDNRKSNDSIAKSRTSPSEHRRTPSDQSYELPHQQQPQKQQSLPDRMSTAYHRANKENLLLNHFDPTSPGSGFSDPVTERCEKDAQFVYNEERLYVNQQNIGRLSPRTSSEFHSMSNMTKYRSRSLEHYYVEEYITNRRPSDENIAKDLNSFQTSMSLLIDKDDAEESSKQTYIYQSTLSRLPVTIKNLDSCYDSTTSNDNNDTIETEMKSEKYTKHELFVCRKPTYYFNIPVHKSQTFPKHTCRTEVKLHPHSPTSPPPTTTATRTPLGYHDKFEMIIRVNDSHSTSDREDDFRYDTSTTPTNNNNNNAFNRRKTPRQRMYTSLPRTRHALLYYPQPGSPGLILDSPVADKSQANYQPSASIKHGSTDPPHYRKARYPNSYFRKDDQPSIDRKEKFLRKYEKTKASSEINYTIHNGHNNNKILSDINQSLSNDYYQYYQSSTDISSVLSREGDASGFGVGGDSLKIYLNRYVERSEKHWSLPRSHHLLLNDDSMPGRDRISEQSEFSDNLSKDVGSNDEKAGEKEKKKDLKLPRKVEDSRKSLKSPPAADSLNFYFLEPYKRYTDNRKQDDYPSEEVKKISQEDEEEEEKDDKEKANIDDILNQAYQDEMSRMKKRQQSIKTDNYGSTSSLGVLVKKYEDQAKNALKDTERKSNSMKNRKRQPDEEANQLTRPVEPTKPTDEAGKPRDDTSRIKHKDPSSHRYLHDITSGENKQQPETSKTPTTDLPKRHSRTGDDKGKHQASIDSPQPFNKPTPVPETPPKVLEKPDRMSKSLDKKPKPSDQSNTNEGDTITNNNNKPSTGEKPKSQEPESKHQHRHPPTPPHHHRTSTKHDDDGDELKHSDKRVNDGPTPFSKFKKDMALSDRPKPDSRPAPHEETTTFSRDSKFRRPIHTPTEGQTGGNLPPAEKRKSLPGIKATDDKQRKSSKEKPQLGDTKGLNSSLQDRDKMLKDKPNNERNRVPEPTRSSKSPHQSSNQHHRHHSLRVKQYNNKPYPGITAKDDRISSWIENSKQQTRRLLLGEGEEEEGGAGGEIDPSPDLERHRPSLTRHQSLNEDRRYSDDRRFSSGSGTVKRNEAKNRSKHADQDQSPEKQAKKEIVLPKPDPKTDVPKDPIALQAMDQVLKRRESGKDNRHRPPSNKPDQDQNSRQETKQPVDRKKSDKQPTDTLNKPHLDQPTTDLPNDSKISPPSKRRHQSREDFKQPKLSSTKPQSDVKDEDHPHRGKDIKHNDKPTPHRSKEPSRENQINRRRDNTHSPSADREEHRLTPPDRDIKVADDHRPGHKRHPPPPLSPTSKRDIHYPRDATYNQPRTPHDSSQTVPTKHFSKYPGDGDMYDPEGRRRRTRPEHKEPVVPSDPRKAKLPHGIGTGANGLAKHPDEYNYLAEAEKQKPTADYCTSELSDGSSLYGKTSQGSTRKQPFKSLDKYKSKDTEPAKPHRHPPPPQPTDHSRSKPKRGDERSSRKSDRKPDYANENQYMNLPGSIPHGARPPNERNRSLQDLTERSGLHSVYDPRLVDEPTVPYKPQTIDRIPIRQQQEPKSPEFQQQRSYTSEDDSEDYSDSGGSDEVLRPPALRTIPQTRRQSEPKLPSEDNYPPVQLRRPSSKGLKTPGQLPYDDGIISPEGMSIPSTPGYENIYDNYNERTGKYTKGSQHRTGASGLSSGILSQERVSRPRSKHATATSQGSGYYGVTGSKHSLIISTKRRTFSGVTGTHPSKHRSSSMNTLWFGDHPIPSESTLSPSTPIKLSNIQLQAQAELERRHRSASSHAHSLDRKSNYSGGNTESHLSKGGLSESQGYEGVGYAYDSRGRLIHGGACLPERSASRKRRLLDGHESLSRVWIPQAAEHYPINQNVTDRTASLLTNRDERQAQLDNSAMAFALKDFNTPKIRRKRGTHKPNAGDNENTTTKPPTTTTTTNIIQNKARCFKNLRRTQSFLSCCMR